MRRTRTPVPRMLLLLIVAALALAATAATAAGQTRTVSVSGFSSQTVHNDTARLGIAVHLDRETARRALDDTSATMRRVIRRVQSAGKVAGRDISTTGVSVNRVTIGGPGDRHTVFRARQSVGVVIRRVELTGAAITAAVDAGATNVGNPRFSVSDASGLYNRALAAAFSNARQKARALARRAGAKLGPALRISEGGGVRALPVAGDASGGAVKGRPPVHPGRSKVSASVRVEFRIS